MSFDFTAAAREVIAGTRRAIPRDGQWWVAMGIEQVGQPSLTRLFDKDAVPNEDDVAEIIAEVFLDHSGPGVLRPHLAESRFVGRMASVQQDIILARITGRHRPIGAWVVAVPPSVVGSRA